MTNPSESSIVTLEKQHAFKVEQIGEKLKNSPDTWVLEVHFVLNYRVPLHAVKPAFLLLKCCSAVTRDARGEERAMMTDEHLF